MMNPKDNHTYLTDHLPDSVLKTQGVITYLITPERPLGVYFLIPRFRHISYCHFLDISLSMDTNHNNVFIENIPNRGSPYWPLMTPKDNLEDIQDSLQDGSVKNKVETTYLNRK